MTLFDDLQHFCLQFETLKDEHTAGCVEKVTETWDSNNVVIVNILLGTKVKLLEGLFWLLDMEEKQEYILTQFVLTHLALSPHDIDKYKSYCIMQTHCVNQGWAIEIEGTHSVRGVFRNQLLLLSLKMRLLQGV